MSDYIYSLSCPTTGEVRYIGKTRSPRTRLHAHVSKAKTYQLAHYCSAWIRSLLTEGKKPVFSIVHEVPEGACWQEAEKHLILVHRQIGCRLTNHTSGGEGFYAPDKVVIAKRTASRNKTLEDPSRRDVFNKSATKSWEDPTTRANREQGVLSSWADPEKRQRYIDGMRTEEGRKNRSEATKKRMQDPEEREKHKLRMQLLAKDPARKAQLDAARAKRWADYRLAKAAKDQPPCA